MAIKKECSTLGISIMQRQVRLHAMARKEETFMRLGVDGAWGMKDNLGALPMRPMRSNAAGGLCRPSHWLHQVC